MKRNNLTMMEVAICIAIIAILACMLIPVMKSARERAYKKVTTEETFTMKHDVYEITFEQIDNETKESFIPAKAHESDAGYDLRSAINYTLKAGERHTVPARFKMSMSKDLVAFVCPRSGIAAKNGITIVNAPGVVDSGYTGEVCVILLNTSSEDFVIKRGDRIGQMVFMKLPPIVTVKGTIEKDTDRGEGGFGSTGAE